MPLARGENLTVEEACHLIRTEPSQYELFHYNNCYGGDGTVNERCVAWMERQKQTEDNEDVRFIQAVDEIGTKDCMQETHSRMGVCLVQAKYMPWMTVHDYDGLQTPHFHAEKYLADAIASHFASNDCLSKERYEALLQCKKLDDVFSIIRFAKD